MRPARIGMLRFGTLASIVLVCIASLTLAPWAGAEANGERDRLLEQIRRAPRQADGFAALATWLFRSGDVDRATAAAAEAARLAPDVASHFRLLGYLRAASGAEREAEAAFQRAADLDPKTRGSLADFHVARAWAEYQEALRSGHPDPTLEERLRAVAAVAELTPELKALMPSRVRTEGSTTAEVVPPVLLSAEVPYALVVEKRSQSVRLYGQRDGEVVLLQTYPSTTGQVPGVKQRRGDRRTPDGVYVVTDLLPGSQLPELYGTLALPLNYPNGWDRRLRRNGYGIWLHGSDRLGSPFSRRDTQGCVIVRNEDLLDLARLITPGVTPIVIAEDVPYYPVAEWQSVVQELLHDVPVAGVLSVAATPEYAVIAHRQGESVVQDFVEKKDRWRAVESEQAPLTTPEEWQAKLAGVLPSTPATLLSVVIRDDEDPPRIEIETDMPVEARGFRPELAERLYLDLPGVRSAPVPAILQGRGPWVKQVRVASTEVDPPMARLVIDLRTPMDYRIKNDGGRIVVSLLPDGSG